MIEVSDTKIVATINTAEEAAKAASETLGIDTFYTFAQAAPPSRAIRQSDFAGQIIDLTGERMHRNSRHIGKLQVR